MLHSFSCKNFYSINQKVEFSFVVNNKSPNDGGYIKSDSGIKLSKVEAILGPNASGKTNLLKVLPFVQWLILDSFNAKPDDPIQIRPFALNKNKNSELSVVFEINGFVYTYNVVLNNLKIESEELLVKTKSRLRKTAKRLFFRYWDNDLNKYILKDYDFKLPVRFANYLRKNTSLFASAVRLNHKLSLKISSYWNLLSSNVKEVGWVNDINIPESYRISQIMTALDNFRKDPLFKERAENIIKRFDLGLNNLEFREVDDAGHKALEINAIHKYKSNKFTLPFIYESSGTRQLLATLSPILRVLDAGGVVVLDEFDSNLHPEISSNLLEMFFYPETNPNNAQLIFTTHNPININSLDKYQIAFTEKDAQGSTTCKRLDNIKGVRPDDNYFSKYLAGAYGGIPNIKP